MSEESKVIKYVDLEGLKIYDQLIKEQIAEEDAKSLKTVVLDGNTLKFYRTMEPIAEGAVPAYTVDLPETDLSGYLHKITNPTDGHIVTTDANGNVVDSGTALGDLATEKYVDDKVAEEVGKISHLVAQIVEEAPEDSSAKANIIYLVKDNDATGDDVYKEYLLIDGVVTCIGDTTTDLSNVYTKDVVDGKISTAKQEAISSAVSTAAEDATTKADTALSDAKKYTDEEVAKDRERLDTAESDIDTLEGKVDALETSSSQYEDRIQELESELDTISVATEDEIRALFPETN
jgi:uncharacterized phage infection (PIP) family protein YhgE